MSCRSGSGSCSRRSNCGERLAGIVADARVGETAEQPVHFLGAAMARAKSGAPAAAFDVVGHDSSALITRPGA